MIFFGFYFFNPTDRPNIRNSFDAKRKKKGKGGGGGGVALGHFVRPAALLFLKSLGSKHLKASFSISLQPIQFRDDKISAFLRLGRLRVILFYSQTQHAGWK